VIIETPEAIAKRLGIVYNGEQERWKNTPLYMFTDKKTGSTLGTPDLTEVEAKLTEMRVKFGLGASN
jgi:hypothetical protein